jgi:hypothetical protein
VAASPSRRDLHRQPGLADAARADQGHQAAGGVVEQLVQPGQLLLAAEQRAERPWRLHLRPGRWAPLAGSRRVEPGELARHGDLVAQGERGR